MIAAVPLEFAIVTEPLELIDTINVPPPACPATVNWILEIAFHPLIVAICVSLVSLGTELFKNRLPLKYRNPLFLHAYRLATDADVTYELLTYVIVSADGSVIVTSPSSM